MLQLQTERPIYRTTKSEPARREFAEENPRGEDAAAKLPLVRAEMLKEGLASKQRQSLLKRSLFRAQRAAAIDLKVVTPVRPSAVLPVGISPAGALGLVPPERPICRTPEAPIISSGVVALGFSPLHKAGR